MRCAVSNYPKKIEGSVRSFCGRAVFKISFKLHRCLFGGERLGDGSMQVVTGPSISAGIQYSSSENKAVRGKKKKEKKKCMRARKGVQNAEWLFLRKCIGGALR